jgi:tripartite-type tricarboxylate transporter receptor subunit TctC
MAWAPAHAADAYPARRVIISVPFAAGGSADVYARFLAQYLQEDLGQPFIVENRPGAGSIVGTEAVKNAPADGYTLLLMSNTQTVNETLFAKKSYALMTDFVAIAPINSSDLVLVTRPNLGLRSIGDLIKAAKDNPGGLTFASSGPGTPYHMAGEMFKALAGVNILHVPYRGSSGARTDVLGGHVDMMFDAPTTMAEFVRSGQVVGLATTGKARSPDLPNLPTMGEAVPGYEAVIWLGVMAPKGTPQPVVDRLNAAITKIVQRPDIQESWRKQGAEPLVMSPARFTEFLRADIEKWAEVVRVSGAKAD